MIHFGSIGTLTRDGRATASGTTFDGRAAVSGGRRTTAGSKREYAGFVAKEMSKHG